MKKLIVNTPSPYKSGKKYINYIINTYTFQNDFKDLQNFNEKSKFIQKNDYWKYQSGEIL